ncbi:Hpt domain-containing protein [Stagnihabitans tardus]|uniref:Hpt domain-containing protein n=1 Tax=Stagnihabitans tardus TaxID=2699202 RepID=A0AAE4YBT2_9RHOB|nr:Hpt domain-containing protein [Stagnihabitans tardus]NBZ86775.1 Hpt domain-containing protein [Stagnihabitans tardus]
MTDDRLIDWARVRELRYEIGEDGFEEVVGLFLDEADETVARLSPDVGAKKFAADLHYLKGAALNLGFQALAACCQDGERRANQGDLSVDLDLLRSTYAESRARFLGGQEEAFAA